MKRQQLQIMNLKNDETNRVANLTMYGDIGEYYDEISSKEIISKLNEMDVDNINLYINSNGGDVTTAIAILNSLKRHKAKVTAHIDGLAASAATIITSACDVVKMPKNALFMVHNPWTIAMGDKNDLNKTVDVLDKMKDSILETYVAKTKQDKEVLSKLMDEETWLNAEEALNYGFVDEIIEDKGEVEVINNKLLANGIVFNMSKFSNFNNKKQIIVEEKKTNNKKEVIMTREEIKNQFPDVYKEIVNEGRELENSRLNELWNDIKDIIMKKSRVH